MCINQILMGTWVLYKRKKKFDIQKKLVSMQTMNSDQKFYSLKSGMNSCYPKSI